MSVMLVKFRVHAFIEYEDEEDYERKLDALEMELENFGTVDYEDADPMDDEEVSDD